MRAEYGASPNIGVLLEQTLGHVSHGRNLQQTFAATNLANVSCRELAFEPTGLLDQIPPRSNWTLRSSLAARSAVADLMAERPLDALFVHTHVPATLLGSTMLKVPTVISIDATPRQIDSLASSYNHEVGSNLVEGAKWRMHVRCFQRAASLVAWSKWAADSLVEDYGVDRDRIEIIPPGVVIPQWQRPEPREITDNVVRVLFVGGDFTRKGGELLIEAVQRLRNDPEVVANGTEIELHLVTSADVESSPGIEVHKGLTSNCPELIELYHRCDIFALPTRGDCTPLVLAEAAAAGLPSVATDVGAISESVIDGETGYLVQPEVESLMAGLRPMVVDAEHRLTLGRNAARHALENMDSEKNALRVLDGLIQSARRPSTGRSILTVSGEVAPDIDESIEAGIRPLADYMAISDIAAMPLLDWKAVRRDGSFATNILRRLAGNSAAMAFHLYRRRRDYDVVVTDGEQVGLPLAALIRFSGRQSPFHHMMIGHRLSPKKKTIPIRLLGLSRGVDDVLVYSSSQLASAQELFGRIGQRVRLIDFMVDTEFFQATRELAPRSEGQRPMICTAGREFRDYPTFIEAVRDLDADVVIASASPWSKRSDNAGTVDLPSNVTITALSQSKLRALFDEADALVMPLQETDFQAGITTILEAMAMERPVICTSTTGQTDVVVDGLNGSYVEPGDPVALRKAIENVLGNPEEAAAMGQRGRELVEKRADVRIYAGIFKELLASRKGAFVTEADLDEQQPFVATACG